MSRQEQQNWIGHLSVTLAEARRALEENKIVFADRKLSAAQSFLERLKNLLEK